MLDRAMRSWARASSPWRSLLLGSSNNNEEEDNDGGGVVELSSSMRANAARASL